MNNPNLIELPNPPSYLNSIKKGFDTVANHIQIILIPIVLDLFFLFGPQLRITNLILSYINTLIIQYNVFVPFANSLNQSNNPSTMAQQISMADQMLILNTSKENLSILNLFVNLRTFPLGIPSVIYPGVIKNPIGIPIEIELTSIETSLLLTILLPLIGLGLGVIYFCLLSNLAIESPQKISLKRYFWLYSQFLIFGIGLFITLIFVITPGLMLSTFLSALNPLIGTLIFFGFIFILIWLTFPLIYTLHGIFIYQKNIISSAFTSFTLVRSSIPGSGLFISLIILVYFSFNSLWRIPPTDSWLILASIAGHAFLFSGLFLSSVIYYRNSIEWMREVIKRNPRPVTQLKI